MNIDKVKSDLKLRLDIVTGIEDIQDYNLYLAISDYCDYMQSQPVINEICDSFDKVKNLSEKDKDAINSYKEIKFITDFVKFTDKQIEDYINIARYPDGIDDMFKWSALKNAKRGIKIKLIRPFNELNGKFNTIRLNAYILEKLNGLNFKEDKNLPIKDITYSFNKDGIKGKLITNNKTVDFDGKRACILNFFYGKMDIGSDELFDYLDYNNYIFNKFESVENTVQDSDSFRRQIGRINNRIEKETEQMVREVIFVKSSEKKSVRNQYKWEIKY